MLANPEEVCYETPPVPLGDMPGGDALRIVKCEI
jgi:hypothetical protein